MHNITTIPRNTVIKRLNRRLEKHNLKLRVTKPYESGKDLLGKFFISSLFCKVNVIEFDVDLMGFVDLYDVLRTNEAVAL